MISKARILLVEDDALLALDMAAELERAGFQVIGPAASVKKAIALLDGLECDAAVLDIHLGKDETSEPVAMALLANGKPFVTVTGYSRDQRPPIFNDAPLISKPLQIRHLIAELDRCLKI